MVRIASMATGVGLILGLCLLPPDPASAAADPAPKVATVSVDFGKSRGSRLEAEKFNNVSRATTFTAQRDADVAFFNDQGLHGRVYRVWVDVELINKPGSDTYDFEGVSDYLADLSRLSDTLLVVLDTRVSVRDHQRRPEQIKPVIRKVLRELKVRFPQIRYIEAFNEPDHNLAKTISPQQLYDFYIPYYEIVNEINRELKPKVPLEVGGPAFMQYNEEWLRAFLDRYKADRSPQKRLDFISWHGYGTFPPGSGDAGGPRAYHFYKFDPSEVADQRSRLESELRSRGLDARIPAFITELGIYPGPSFDNAKDPRPDYLIQAAGVPSLLYWYLEQSRTFPFNWVVRHKTEERKDQLITRAGPGGEPPVRTFSPYGNAMLMMSKLKAERVAARSDGLVKGKGVYAIASKDRSGAAVMVWNYQHVESQSYRATIQMARLPSSLRGKSLRLRRFRIDQSTSNYWANPAAAQLQEVSSTLVRARSAHSVTVDLPANALELITLEPVPGRAGDQRRS